MCFMFLPSQIVLVLLRLKVFAYDMIAKAENVYVWEMECLYISLLSKIIDKLINPII